MNTIRFGWQASQIVGQPPVLQKRSSELSKPSADCFVRQVGLPGAIRFGQRKVQKLSPIEIQTMLSSPLNAHRMEALDALLEKPPVNDPDLQLTLARLLYFEDYYQDNNPRSLTRVKLMQVLAQCPPTPWINDALLMTTNEYGNTNLAKLAISTLARTHGDLSDSQRRRFKTDLFATILNGSNNFQNLENTKPLLRMVLGPEDINYALYLCQESSMRGKSSVLKLRTLFPYLIEKVYGWDGLKAGFNLFCAKRGNNALDVGLGEGLLSSIVERIPEAILLAPDGKVRGMPEGERLAKFHDLFDMLMVLAGQRTWKGDVLTDSIRKQYCWAMGLLVEDLPPDVRKDLAGEVIHRALTTLKDTQEKHIPDLMALALVFLEGKPMTFADATDYFKQVSSIPRRSPKPAPPDPMPYPYFRPAASESERDPDFVRRLKRTLYPNKRFPEGSPELDILRKQFSTFQKKHPEFQYKHVSYLTGHSSPDEQWEEVLQKFKSRLNEPIPSWRLSGEPIRELPRTWPIEDFKARNQSDTDRLKVEARSDAALRVFQRGNLTAEEKSECKQHIGERIELWAKYPTEPDYQFLQALTRTEEGLNLFTQKTVEAFEHIVDVQAPGSLATITHRQIPLAQGLLIIRDAVNRSSRPESIDMPALSVLLRYAVTIRPEMGAAALGIIFKALQGIGDGISAPERKPGEIAALVHGLCRRSLSDQVLEENGGTLAKLLVHLPKILMGESGESDPLNGALSWSSIGSGQMEEDQARNDKALSPATKMNMALSARLAVKSGSPKVLGRLVDSLWSVYNRLRVESYVDEYPLIRVLSQPGIVEIGNRFPENAEGEQRFNQLCEMLGWYKVFEAVPALMSAAAKTPNLARQSTMLSTIGLIGSYALPSLEKIVVNGTPREQELASFMLGEMQKARGDQELFSPYPYPIPRAFLERLEAVRQGEPIGGNSKVIKDNGFWGRIRLAKGSESVDLSAFSQEAAMNRSFDSLGTGNARSRSEMIREAEAPLTLIGFEDEVGDDGSGTLMSRMLKLVKRLRDNPPSREKPILAQALSELGRQVGVMARNPQSGLAFETRERAQLESELTAYMLQNADSMPDEVKAGILEALSIIATEAETGEQLCRLFEDENNPSILSGLLALMGNVRAGMPSIAARIIREDAYPENLRIAGMQALRNMGDNTGLVQIINAFVVQLPERVAVAGIEALAENLSVESDESVVRRVVSGFENMLVPAGAGSQLQTALIKGIIALVEPDDTQSRDILINVFWNASQEAKLEIIDACGTIFDASDASITFLSRISQEGEASLATPARQMLSDLQGR